MALDFPTSPANGATYSGYTYDATKGVWVIPSSTITNMTVSDTAPSNPLSGDSWFDSNTGYVFVYYTDANSSQWVQTTGAYIDTALTNRVTTVETRTTAVEGVNTTQNSRLTSLEGYAQQSPNYIINGAFDIWQRGTSFSNAAFGAYTADRWSSNLPTGSAISIQSAGLSGFQYCMRVQRSSGQTTTANFFVGTPVEIALATQLQGKTVTLSFYARGGANLSSTNNSIIAYLYTGTGATEVNRIAAGYTGDATPIVSGVTLTTSWQRFSFTASIPANVTQFTPIFLYQPTGTAGANDYYEITGVQLEAGSTATPFRRNTQNIQEEMAACQRYYITGTMGGTYYMGSGNSVGVGSHSHSFVPMRVAPTATVSTFTNSDNASNGGVQVLGNGRVNGNFRNSNTSFPYYNFTATFRLEAEL